MYFDLDFKKANVFHQNFLTLPWLSTCKDRLNVLSRHQNWTENRTFSTDKLVASAKYIKYIIQQNERELNTW